MAQVNAKQHAHELIERMAPGQLSAVVGMLEMILDPLARSLATAPWEDEEADEEEERAVAASKAWLVSNPGQGTAHEDVVTEFGVTAQDVERTVSMPPDAKGTAR